MAEAIGLEGKFDVSNFNAGLNAYIAGLLKAQQATDYAVDTLNKLGNVKSFSGFGSSLSTLANQISSLGNAGQTAGGQMQSFGQSFQQGIAQGIGQQAVSLFQNLGGAILDAGKSAFETVAFYERLGLTIKSIVADTIQEKDASLSLAQAMEMAEKPAQAVEQMLEKIAILSPFNPREVSIAFQTATAYGFTANEAIRLTQALVNFASVKGLSGDQMKRIALALSQINAKGKLAAQEINQLADAGVPVRDILGKAFGLTKVELEKLLAKGVFPANDAISAIVQNMERYDGAAKKATLTFSGLVSTLAEIQQFAGRDLFGAIFKPLQPLLNSFVQFATTEQFSADLKALGEVIGGGVTAAIQNLTGYVNGLLQAWAGVNPQVKEGLLIFAGASVVVTGLIATLGALTLILGALTSPFVLVIGAVSALAAAWVENFGGIQQATFSAINYIADAMNSLAQTAVSWGNNIIDSVAQGIAGAVDLVVSALNVIGSAITYFLQPGSPPKLLPDLDKWGTGAADAYLSGWKDADFGFLDTFGNFISTKINNLAGQGKIDQEDVGTRILGGRLAFTDALKQLREFGSVSDATITKIAKTTTFAKSTVEAFLSRYLNVTKATEKLDSAQKALNDSMTGYDRILNPLKAHLKAIKDAQQKTQDQVKIAQLNRVINATGVTAARKKAAQLELDELLTERQISRLEDLKTASQESGQARVDEASSGLDVAKGQLDILQKQTQETLNLGGLLKQTLKQHQDINNALSERKKKLDEELDPLKEQLKAYQLQSEALADHVKEAKLKAILEDKDATAAQKAAAAYELKELAVRKQIRAVEAERLAAKGFAVDLAAIEKIPVVLADIEKKGKAAKPVMESVMDAFSGISDLEINEKFEEFGKTLDKSREKIGGWVTQFNTLVTKINDALPTFLSLKQSADGTTPGIVALKGAFELFAAFFVTSKLIGYLQALPALLGAIFSKANLITFAISLLATAWFNNWGGIQEKTATAVDAIKKKFTELTGITGLDDVKTKLGEFFTAVKGYFNDPTTIGGGAKAGATSALGFVSKFISDNFSEEKINAGLATIKTTLTGFFASVQSYVNDPTTLGGKAKAAVTNAVSYLQQFAQDHFNEQTVTDALAIITPILSGFFSKVKGYVDNPNTLIADAQTAATASVGYLTKFAQEHFNTQTVTDALAIITPILTDFFTKVKSYVDDPSSLVGQAKNTATVALNYLTKFATDTFNTKAVQDALAIITPILTDFFTKIKGYFDDPSSLLGGKSEPTTPEVNNTSQLINYVNRNFNQKEKEGALQKIVPFVKQFLSDIHVILYGNPKEPEPETGLGSSGSVLSLFASKNFGPEAIHNMLEYVKKLWGNTGTIIMDSVFQPLKDALDKDDGKPIGTRIANFIIRGIGIAIGATIQYIYGVLVPELITSIGALALFLFYTLPQWFHDAFGAVLDYLSNELPGALHDAAGSVVDGFINGLDMFFDTTLGIPHWYNAMLIEFKTIRNYLTITYPAQLKAAGSAIIEGLHAGIVFYWNEKFLPAIEKLWPGLVDNIKKFFGIASPSTLMHDGPGSDISAGLLGGISDYLLSTENIKVVLDALSGLVTSMFSADTLKKFTDAAYNLGTSIIGNIKKGFDSLVSGGKSLLSYLTGGGDEGTVATPKVDTSGAAGAQKELIASFAAISASLKPGDVVVALNAIVVAFQNLRTAVKGEIEGMGADTLASLLQLQINLLPQMAAFVKLFTENFQTIRANVKIEVDGLKTDTTTTLGTLKTETATILSAFVTAVVAQFKKMRADSMTEVNGLISDIKNAFNSASGQILGPIKKFKDDFVQVFKDMRTETGREVDGLVTDVLGKFTGAGGLLAKLQSDFVAKGEKLGGDFVDLIAKGITNGTDAVVAAAAKMGDAVIEEVKKKQQELANATPPSGGDGTTGGGNTGGGGNGTGGGTGGSDDAGPRAAGFSLGGVFSSALGNASDLINSRIGSSQSAGGIIYNTTNIYNLNVNSSQASRGIMRDFDIMQVMAG